MSAPQTYTTGSTGQATSARAGRRSWRVIAPLICVGLIIASVLFIAAYTYRSNRRVVLDLSGELLDSVEQRIASEVESYLEPASVNATLAARLGADDALQMDPHSRLSAVSVELLRQHSQLAMVNVADSAGNFMMPKKMPNGAIDTKLIDRRSDPPQVMWIRRDPAGDEVDTERADFDGYDPRVRPWYLGASESGKLFWTNVYIFFTDRQPGMTAAYPVVADDGETLGVIGIDIELDHLCDFLAKLHIGKTGRGMLIDERGTLIAYPDIRRISKMEGEKIRPVSILELDDPVLTRTWSRFQVEQYGRRMIEVDGSRYITTVKPLANVGRNWSILITVPEEDFVGLLRANNRTALVMSIGVIVLGLMLAGMLATQSVRADRNAALVAHREEELEVRSRAFSELIAGLSERSLDTLATLRHMTEHAAVGAGVQRVSLWRRDPSHDALECMDAFERGAGHSDGSELKAAEYPRLFRAMAECEAIEVTRDGDQAALIRNYLQPLRIAAVLMLPVVVDGEARIWVWFERGEDDPEIMSDDRAYADAIAGLVALGCGELQKAPVQSIRTVEPEAPRPIVEDQVSATEDTADEPVTREVTTPEPMRRELAVADSVTMHAEALALSICIDDPDLLLAADDGHGRTIGQAIVDRISRAVDAGQVSHWMAAGSTFCCVSIPSPQRETSQGDALAALAMDIRQYVADRLGMEAEEVGIRQAIDCGSVGVLADESVGGLAASGRAIVGAIALAQATPAGAIQLSAAAEDVLEANFVCRERGLYFIDGVGEMNTFVLVGRLRT